MVTRTQTRPPEAPRVRRGYFECRHGQLHLHHAIPAGGGFEEGTTLVALHPASSTGRLFTGLLASMGTDRSTFAPDLPGFGQSDGAAAPLSTADHAAAIGDFLDSMRLRQIDLLGCGLGALVAIELARSRPGVRRLVVIPTPPAEIVAPAGGSAGPAPGQGQPLGARLSQLTQPTLALCPPDMPPALAKELADLPVRARRELPGGLALFETTPGAVTEAIREFLS